MGFVDKSDRTVNSYGIARRTCKWIKKLFFHLTDITILNTFLIHKSSGGKMTHKNFREILVRELIIQSQEENVTASGISRGRPNPIVSQLCRLEIKHSERWFSRGKQRQCCVWSLHKQTWSMLYFCRTCDKRRIGCADARQIICLYSMDGKICRVNKCCIPICTEHHTWQRCKSKGKIHKQFTEVS